MANLKRYNNETKKWEVVGGIPIDKSLTNSNIAADAKVVGDKINNISSNIGDLASLSTTSKNNIVSALNEVKDLGNEIIAQDNAPTDTSKIWLDTDDTTMNSVVPIDKTLTKSGMAADSKMVGDKLNTAVLCTPMQPNLTAEQMLQAKANIGAGDFVTPEMFGAVGDGVHDDTDAVQKAIFTKKTIVLTRVYNTNGFIIQENQIIINRGILKLKSPIIFKNFGTTGGSLNSGYIGGVIEIKNSPAFLLDSQFGVIRRFMIHDVMISGTYDESCTAIKSVYTNTEKYVTFVDINNVIIYHCYKGFEGHIGGSYINIKIEQCHYPMVISGCHNNIIITGQTMDSSINKNIVTVNDGVFNNIFGGYWDIAAHPNWQNVFVYYKYTCRYNNTFGEAGRIISENTGNTQTKYGYHSDLYLIPKEKFTESNILSNNIYNFDPLNFINFHTNGFVQYECSDKSLEGTITVILPKFRSFFGFKMDCYTDRYSPNYFEVFKGDKLIDKQYSSRDCIEWYPIEYRDAYDNLMQEGWKIVFHLERPIRIFGVQFYR